MHMLVAKRSQVWLVGWLGEEKWVTWGVLIWLKHVTGYLRINTLNTHPTENVQCYAVNADDILVQSRTIVGEGQSFRTWHSIFRAQYRGRWMHKSHRLRIVKWWARKTRRRMWDYGYWTLWLTVTEARSWTMTPWVMCGLIASDSCSGVGGRKAMGERRSESSSSGYGPGYAGIRLKLTRVFHNAAF